MSSMQTSLRIEPQRLFDSLMALGRIGAYFDEPTGLTGVNRLALTDRDAEGRRQVQAWMLEAGLTVTIDQVGNVFGLRPGRDASLAPVMMGSHIDSVPTGGAFDGALGVMAGLEVIRTLNQSRVQTLRPLVLAFFTDEEGARFGTDMLGSAVATGRLSLEHVYALTDAEGARVGAELARIGFIGPEQPGHIRPAAYLECHVEQGPVLHRAGLELGVVTGVQAIRWHQLVVTGRAAHAGTTPMELRRDAAVATARLTLGLRALTQDPRFKGGLRATMGGFQPVPGLVNIVPGRVHATADLRHPDNALMDAAEQSLLALYAQVEQEEQVEIRWKRTASTPAVHFHPFMQDCIDAAAEAFGFSRQRFISGAGHDAQEWSRVCPTGMIFVPGEYDGLSHNPREYSTPEACARGANVLLQVAFRLAESEVLPSV